MVIPILGRLNKRLPEGLWLARLAKPVCSRSTREGGLCLGSEIYACPLTFSFKYLHTAHVHTTAPANAWTRSYMNKKLETLLWNCTAPHSEWLFCIHGNWLPGAFPISFTQVSDLWVLQRILHSGVLRPETRSLGRQAKVGLDQLLEPVNSAGERESSMPSHSLLPVQVQCSCSLCLI